MQIALLATMLIQYSNTLAQNNSDKDSTLQLPDSIVQYIAPIDYALMMHENTRSPSFMSLIIDTTPVDSPAMKSLSSPSVWSLEQGWINFDFPNAGRKHAAAPRHAGEPMPARENRPTKT